MLTLPEVSYRLCHIDLSPGTFLHPIRDIKQLTRRQSSCIVKCSIEQSN